MIRTIQFTDPSTGEMAQVVFNAGANPATVIRKASATKKRLGGDDCQLSIYHGHYNDVEASDTNWFGMARYIRNSIWYSKREIKA